MPGGRETITNMVVYCAVFVVSVPIEWLALVLRLHRQSGPPASLTKCYAYSTEKKGRAKRIVIEDDRATYFVAIDGGVFIAP